MAYRLLTKEVKEITSKIGNELDSLLFDNEYYFKEEFRDALDEAVYSHPAKNPSARRYTEDGGLASDECIEVEIISSGEMLKTIKLHDSANTQGRPYWKLGHAIEFGGRLRGIYEARPFYSLAKSNIKSALEDILDGYCNSF